MTACCRRPGSFWVHLPLHRLPAVYTHWLIGVGSLRKETTQWHSCGIFLKELASFAGTSHAVLCSPWRCERWLPCREVPAAGLRPPRPPPAVSLPHGRGGGRAAPCPVATPSCEGPQASLGQEILTLPELAAPACSAHRTSWTGRDG